jgi:hypothetical protein
VKNKNKSSRLLCPKKQAACLAGFVTEIEAFAARSNPRTLDKSDKRQNRER